MDITFKTPEGRFNYRAAGIFLHEDKVLLMKDGRSPYYYLPGGRISLHETSTEAILREVREELGVTASIGRLCFVVESYFTEVVAQERFHELAFYYQLTPPQELLQMGESFQRTENGTKSLSFYWKSLCQLPELYLQPAFLKGKLGCLPDVPEHLVLRES